MKKFIINIAIVFSFVIIYILHSNLFTWFTIAGVMPNLFVILVLFIGLYANRYIGIIYGVIFGLLLDLFMSRNIGITAIMLGIIGVIGVIFDKNFSKENRITLIVMVMICTVVFESGEYIISYFINKFDFEIISFIQILLIECLYNSILTIILYPLIQNFGNIIETEYKGNKILTRYF